MTSNLERPTFYLESFRINNDRVFGTQILTEWNLYQLLGFRNPPRGTDWTGEFDYLSKRGPAIGTNFRYDRESVFHIPGRTFGFLHAWGIHDTGLDNLGRGRRAVPFESNSRGRILGRHRQFLDDGFQFTGEIGFVSDRNFLEQYYEVEWDEEKDQTTGIEFKRLNGNKSWSVTADARVNDFFHANELVAPRGPLLDRPAHPQRLVVMDRALQFGIWQAGGRHTAHVSCRSGQVRSARVGS